MRERGAVVVEYALLVALVALLALGAVRAAGQHASDRFEQASERVGDRKPGGVPPSPETPSVPPPSTAPVTPEPDAGVAASTTTIADEVAGSGFDQIRVEDLGWSWQAVAELVVRAGDGAPLPGAEVSVQVWRHERTRSGWTWRSRTAEVVVDADGRGAVRSLEFPPWGVGTVDQLAFTLTDVVNPDWDRAHDTIQLER